MPDAYRYPLAIVDGLRRDFTQHGTAPLKPPIDVESQIDGLLAKFANAAMDGAPERIADFYDFPAGVVHPTGMQLFATRQELCDDMAASLEAHLDTGVRAIAYEALQICSYTPVLARVDVRWDHIGATGSVLRSLYSSIFLRWQDEGYRIALHVSHNEVLERPVRQSA